MKVAFSGFSMSERSKYSSKSWWSVPVELDSAAVSAIETEAVSMHADITKPERKRIMR
jgi:hypothetical protein